MKALLLSLGIYGGLFGTSYLMSKPKSKSFSHQKIYDPRPGGILGGSGFRSYGSGGIHSGK